MKVSPITDAKGQKLMTARCARGGTGDPGVKDAPQAGTRPDIGPIARHPRSQAFSA
jgi:hypothetical protein